MAENYSIKSLFSEAVTACIQKNLIFAAYRLPNDESPFLVVQTHHKIRHILPAEDYDLLKGFVVSPFADQKSYPAFLIEPDLFFGKDFNVNDLDRIKRIPDVPKKEKAYQMPEEVSREEYLQLIQSIVERIHRGEFEKVVPSRVKRISGNYSPMLGLLFGLLCAAYPNAFVYVLNCGNHRWMGATPEPFLIAMNGSMQTVSLAGTRPYSPGNLNIGVWNSKERLEQEYVTRYISKAISRFNLTNVRQEGPYTKVAGNLLHLRTDFVFPSADLKGRLAGFLQELHPTPAICGMPCQASLDLLLKLEKHNREYYAGYLGPAGINGNLSLFVNLRCMKVLPDMLALFVGGGITADSIPEDEWQETEIKAETLLTVIRQIKI